MRYFVNYNCRYAILEPRKVSVYLPTPRDIPDKIVGLAADQLADNLCGWLLLAIIVTIGVINTNSVDVTSGGYTSYRYGELFYGSRPFRLECVQCPDLVVGIVDAFCNVHIRSLAIKAQE